jgi:hypothetical protein
MSGAKSSSDLKSYFLNVVYLLYLSVSQNLAGARATFSVGLTCGGLDISPAMTGFACLIISFVHSISVLNNKNCFHLQVKKIWM